jgi:stage III sporulation protein SpoIIIAA
MLLQVLPADIRNKLLKHGRRAELLEVVLDLGRRPEARFLDLGNGQGGGEYLRDEEVTREDLIAAQEAVGDFGGDNRAGVEGTLHRISAIRNRREDVVGLTCRVGRAVTGHIDMIRDILSSQQGILFLGRPGVGKTTVIREMARVLADDFHKRVVIVDTSNEIGGDGDVPHPAIGGARRMQVRDPSMQHRVMIEAVENHMPEVVIVDEIGTEAEALACRSIAERGVQLVGTAHGQMLENLIKNPTLSDLVGGIQSVTLGDEEARNRGTQKSVLERKGPPTFPLVVEMRERNNWVVHQTDRSVDALLHGKRPSVEVRTRDAQTFEVVVDRRSYDSWGNGKLDHEFDYANATEGSTMMSTLRGRQASRASNLLESTYEWAVKMGKVPVKESFADLSMDDLMAAAGYDQGYQSPTPGKRGSRRGSRGSFNSNYRAYEEF